MGYEAPKLTEVGSVRGLTLGKKFDLDADDGIYVFHRFLLPLGDGS